eukprot:scaffold41322_cov17-Tisochrysis_lutea.AAC.1
MGSSKKIATPIATLVAYGTNALQGPNIVSLINAQISRLHEVCQPKTNCTDSCSLASLALHTCPLTPPASAPPVPVLAPCAAACFLEPEPLSLPLPPLPLPNFTACTAYPMLPAAVLAATSSILGSSSSSHFYLVQPMLQMVLCPSAA